MNENDESLPEELIVDSLTPLREVSVPDEVRAANRATIAQALARHAPRPWWQRTVAVPVPVAIAATLTIVAASIALLVPSLNHRSVERTASSSAVEQVIATDMKPDDFGDRSTSAGWTVTRSYLQSIKSLATARVPVDFEIKENRDDS